MRAAMIAFSMYSKIPMPHFEWEEKDRRMAMCFFPMVGVVLGLLFYSAFCLLEFLSAGFLLKGAVLAAVPVFVTGGIHMDGFLDTCDARASYGDRERKLKILKDSHAGAFAVIDGCLYFLLLTAAYSELSRTGAGVLSAGFILSRALSGLAASVLPGARESGMLTDFMKDSNKKRTAGVMYGYILISVALMAFIAMAGNCAGTGSGTERVSGLGMAAAVFAAAMISWFRYRHISTKEFGGVTGDLAGYFLQMCELVMALTVVTAASLLRIHGGIS